MRILIPLPAFDYDPTESAIPWQRLSAAGHEVAFATPDGRPGRVDERVLTGRGFGPWKRLLRARSDAVAAHEAMTRDARHASPIPYASLSDQDHDALLLPGGHAPGMRTLLESTELQGLVARFMVAGRPVAAICHGVVLVARSRDPSTGRSVLHGRRTTALTRRQELAAWWLTRAWLGDYYRTYPCLVETEVRSALARPEDFLPGPMPVARDAPGDLQRGFAVRDGNYLSARWPGDVYRFVAEFEGVLGGWA